MELTGLRVTDTNKRKQEPDDWKLLEWMLSQEDKYIVSHCYFKHTQKEILPFMRKDVTNWMLQVCEDQKCSSAVFPLAVNYLDRFLSIVRLQKSQLQLLASVCLLIASKLRQWEPLNPIELVGYTDHTVMQEELCGWEVLVLCKLHWDVASAVSTDFIEYLLVIMPLNSEINKIREGAVSLINACTKEYRSSFFSSSVLATACVAIVGCRVLLRDTMPQFFPNQFLALVHNITGITVKNVRCCMEFIENFNDCLKNNHGSCNCHQCG